MRSQRRGARGTVGHPYSALNLRLMLATFGLVSCGILAVVAWRLLPVLSMALVALALVAAVDLVVIQRRRVARRREQPGVRHSLFE
jgi:membrane protein implicated in regulation of membrane protease activity